MDKAEFVFQKYAAETAGELSPRFKRKYKRTMRKRKKSQASVGKGPGQIHPRFERKYKKLMKKNKQ